MKGKLIGQIVAVLVGVIGAGILATTLGEKLGYSAGLVYLYAMFGHSKVAQLLESKIK